MKKIVCFFILLVLCTGCNKKLNINNIQLVKFNGVSLIENDTADIISYLNKLSFKNCNNSKLNINFTITTEDTIYNFEVKKDKIIYKGDNNNSYAETSELYNTLNNLQLVYTDDTFYKINHYDTYSLTENDLYIKLDNTSSYYIINTKYELYNFRINEVEINNNDISDINLLYQNDNVNNENIVIRSSNNNLKITFENKYGYMVTIYPSQPLNGENVVFSSSYIKKENSY